jgi:superfamily II DNA/RNA helicase
MLFSATLDHAVDVIVRRFLDHPAKHAVDPPGAPAPIIHHLLTIAPTDRMAVAAALAAGDNRSLIFTRTKHGARKLARRLTAARIPAAELHGNLTQASRERNLARFAYGAVRVMVATDIAARGIHVDGIDLVIHADPPAEHKAYLHRSGRTGRAGASGVVITLQTPAQAGDVRTLMRKARVVPLAATVKPGSALDSRESRQAARAPAPPGGRGTRSACHGKPGSRPPRSRHIRQLPRPAEALTHAGQTHSRFCSALMWMTSMTFWNAWRPLAGARFANPRTCHGGPSCPHRGSRRQCR